LMSNIQELQDQVLLEIPSLKERRGKTVYNYVSASKIEGIIYNAMKV
jgi:hypothetical protein